MNSEPGAPMEDDSLTIHSPIRKVMSTRILSIETRHTLLDAIQLMKQNNVHHLLVLEGQGLQGIISANGILSALVEQNAELKTTTVGQAMETSVITIDEHATIQEAAIFFQKGLLHALPIKNTKGDLIGIITTQDLVKFLTQ